MINKELLIEELLRYSQKHLGMSELDVPYFRNYLYHTFEVSNPKETSIDENLIDDLKVPDFLTDKMMDYFVNEVGLNEKEADVKITEIFGHLVPLPSVVNETFNALYDINPKMATDYLYDLSVKSDYVKKSKIDRNIIYQKDVDDHHDLVVTINLSRPEKNNKDTAKNRGVVSSNYPKCAICYENEGCYGSSKTPPRISLRTISLKLGNRDWFLQYSPFGYFQEHCIVVTKEHTPLEIKDEYLLALFDFVDLFPHYFIGSNAALPIVGGSILEHEHFQGGLTEMPIMRVKNKDAIKTRFNNVNVFTLDWPSFVLKIESKDKKAALEATKEITNIWSTYDDEQSNVISFTNEKHNAMSIIVKKIDDVYNIYLIPRNNRVDEAHPDGIFHVRKEYLAIKSESIGLIEAMGLFILPPRLKRQLATLEACVKKEQDFDEVVALDSEMEIFRNLYQRYSDKEFKNIEDLLFKVCDGIIHDTSVIKDVERQKVFLELLK